MDQYVARVGGIQHVKRSALVRAFPSAPKSLIDEVWNTRRRKSLPKPRKSSRKSGPHRRAAAKSARPKQRKPRYTPRTRPNRKPEDLDRLIRGLIAPRVREMGGVQHVWIGEVISQLRGKIHHQTITKVFVKMLEEAGFSEKDMKRRPRGRPIGAKPGDENPSTKKAPSPAIPAGPVKEVPPRARKQNKYFNRLSKEVADLIRAESERRGGLEHVSPGIIVSQSPGYSYKRVVQQLVGLRTAAGLKPNGFPRRVTGSNREGAVLLRAALEREAERAGGIQNVNPKLVVDNQTGYGPQTIRFYLALLRAEKGLAPFDFPGKRHRHDAVAAEHLNPLFERAAREAGGLEHVTPKMISAMDQRYGYLTIANHLKIHRAAAGQNSVGEKSQRSDCRQQLRQSIEAAITARAAAVGGLEKVNPKEVEIAGGAPKAHLNPASEPSASLPALGDARAVDAPASTLQAATPAEPFLPGILSSELLERICETQPVLEADILRRCQGIGGVFYASPISLKRHFPFTPDIVLRKTLTHLREVVGKAIDEKVPDMEPRQLAIAAAETAPAPFLGLAVPRTPIVKVRSKKAEASAPSPAAPAEMNESSDARELIKVLRGQVRKLQAREVSLKGKIDRLIDQRDIALKERDLSQSLYQTTRKAYEKVIQRRS